MIATLEWPELEKAKVRGHYRRTAHGGRAWVHEHMRHGGEHEGALEEGKKRGKAKTPTFSWSKVGTPGEWGRRQMVKYGIHWRRVAYSTNEASRDVAIVVSFLVTSRRLRACTACCLAVSIVQHVVDVMVSADCP